MVDKKLEENIKKTKEFMELWEKFHAIFHKALRQDAGDKNEEIDFLSTRTLVNSRFDDLMDSLGVKPIMRFIKSEPIYSILSLADFSAMSDEKLNLVDNSWQKSREFLDTLLGRLERKKRHLEGVNPISFLLKKGMIKPKR